MARKKIKRIGVLTSGGDSQGMNAAVRAVVRHALSLGLTVYGIYGGYEGLINGGDEVQKFTASSVNNIIDRGGTALYSARSGRFKTEEGMQKAIETLKKHKIDGLVVIGGDGTFRGASDLCARGIPCVGIPATIDRDITCTDRTIGYDTALNITMRCIDNLRDTDESHARCNVIEAMGRNAGYLAVESAIACGAVGIVVKEDLDYNEDALIEKINTVRANGKRNIMVVVSEGVDGYSEKLAKTIQEKTGIETKFARLAHIVRGGSPTAVDRVFASKMGVEAVELLVKGKQNIFVCERQGKLVTADIQKAVINDKMYKSRFTPSVEYPEAALANYTAKEVKEMEALCKERNDEFFGLLSIVNGTN